MTAPEFSVTPGYGDTQLANMHYSQAVRIGDRVEISGQGGWDDHFNFPERPHRRDRPGLRQRGTHPHTRLGPRGATSRP